MKRIVQILLAILMVMCLTLGIAACKSDCEKGNHDKYIKTEDAATCTTAKVEHWACHNCDWTDDNIVGSPLGHDLSAWTPSATDANKHEKTCSRCDYKETANHTTGAATCPDCGKDLGGSVQPCTHPNKTHTDTPATCTAAKVEHWTCPDCDWTDDVTVGKPLDHLVTTWTPSETEGKHEGPCTREGCGETVVADHVANEDGTECTLCHATLGGTVEPCEHPDKTFTTIDATCTTGEIKHWTCPDCDWTYDETVGEPLDHDYTDRTWTATSDGSQHQMTCTRCDYVKTEDHTPETITGKDATCTADGKEDGSKCSVCNHVISEGEVIPAIPHNYEGQPWKVGAGKHYQECAYGCKTRNEHDEAMGKFVKSEDKTLHIQSCTVAGCTIKNEHAPDWSDWKTDNSAGHYKQCFECELKSEIGTHDQDKLESLNGTQHSVACSVCGREYPNANHVWDEGVVTREPSCTEEGVKTFTCACGATDTDPIDKIAHTEAFTNTETERIVTCSVCNQELDRIAHTFEWYDGDRQQHWKKCETCDYELPGTRANHDYTTNPEEFVCNVCGRVPEGITVSVYYNGTYTSKDTLADAIAFITDNTAATIYLGDSLEGAGIVIPANRNITLRMLGNTYTVTSPVSDTTQGIVLEKGSTVKILNGTITTAENSGVQTLVANYANLTLTNATLDGANLDQVSEGRNCTLVNFYGATTMTSTTIYAKTEANDAAFGIWYGSDSEYTDGVSVTVGASCNIKGIIEYGSAVELDNWDNVVLRLRSNHNYIIKFTSDADCDDVNIKKINVNDASIETQLAHRKDSDWTYDETNVAHYHLCTRCGDHTDAAECTRQTIAGTPATCMENGWTDGEKCSVCGTTITARQSTQALGHNYDETIDGKVNVTKPATCTEDGSKIVTCSRCASTVTRSITALGHDEYKASETDATCTAAKVEHWACTRCDWTQNKTVGEALGHNLSVASTDAATCTTAQIDHMACSRCDYTENQTVGNPLGHDWAAAWTAVDEKQHAHLCQREGCDATNGATNHTYTANHCEACGKTITQDEILATFASLGNNAYLCGSTSTYTLTGLYGGKKGTNQYYLKDADGNVIIVLYSKDVDPSADTTLIEGDTIAVTGPIQNYNGTTIEFNGYEYTIEKRTDEEISVTYNSEQVTVSTIAEKYERGEEITFTVTAKDGYKVDSVTLNGKPLTLQDGEYKFTVTTENVIEIASSSANSLPPHNASGGTETVTITNTAELNIGSASTSYTADNNTGTKEYLGLVFAWNKVIRNNTTNFQMNPKTGGNGAGGYIKITVPGNITSLKIVVNKYDKTMTVNGKGIDSSDITLGDNVKEITISATGSITISSIEITYSTATACTNSQDPAHHDAAPESCTENGNKEYWQCEDCGKYFVKNDAGVYVETTLADITIAAHHNLTKIDASDPTCEEAGNVEYWICSVDGCGAKFTDENGTTPIDDVAIDAIGHDYKYTSNNDGTHTGICQNNNSHVDANVDCTSDTYKHDADNHWKVCDVCNVKFGETAHTGDTCECGAVKLTYKVYADLYYGEDEKVELAGNDLTVTKPAYAVEGDIITVTATSQNYDVVAVVSGTDDFDESTGVYTGAAAGNGIIEIYVSELSTAKYKGATVNGAAAGEIVVTASVGETELENDATLAEGNVINIAVMYDPDDYVITVTVTQGSSVINQVVTLGEYDEEEMTATGTYTCQAMGDVTITVTARAKYTVTIPTIENVTFTVKKVVEGGEEALENGATVLAGDKLSVVANAAANCQIVENSLKVNGVNNEMLVIGDVTMTAAAAKKVTVNIASNDEADIEVTVDGEKVDGEIYITGETTLTITVTVNEGVNKDIDKVTVDGIEQEESNGKYTYTIDAGATAGRTFVVAATLKDKPAGPTILNFVNGDIIKDWTNSYTSHTVTGTDLNTTDVTSVVMSNASKQTGTITDRPTLCAKNANQYVTVTATKDIKTVTFNLTQWGSKTFKSITIEYSTDGANWTASGKTITTPASISYTLPTTVNAKYVRLVYVASSSSNTQMGLTSIELTF